MKALILGLALAVAATPAAAQRMVRLGQTARVGGYEVTPVSVIEDSRCPMNARCIRAGELTVRALVQRRMWRDRIKLTLGKPWPVHGGMVTLVAASPEKYTKPIRVTDYRFGFEARR